MQKKKKIFHYPKITASAQLCSDFCRPQALLKSFGGALDAWDTYVHLEGQWFRPEGR